MGFTNGDNLSSLWPMFSLRGQPTKCSSQSKIGRLNEALFVPVGRSCRSVNARDNETLVGCCCQGVTFSKSTKEPWELIFVSDKQTEKKLVSPNGNCENISKLSFFLFP